MTVILNGKKSIHLGAQAFIVEDAREIASSSWADRAMVNNDAYKWVRGRFVEADNANRNGQMWSHDDLVMAKPSIQYSPMNMLHQAKNIVGAFVDTELVYPEGDQAQVSNAYIEALGVFWKFYHPEAYSEVQKAHEQGKLFYSMECVSESIQFTAPDGRQSDVLAYAGTISDSYGEWNNRGSEVTRQLINPHFIGGALILPPASPGWANAEITELSSLMNECNEELEKTYKQLAHEHSHLDAKELESITLDLLRRDSVSSSFDDSITEDDTPKLVVFDTKFENSDESNEENNNPSKGGDMTTTFSQEQVDAMIAEALTPMQEELSVLRAKSDAEEVETQIAALTEQYDSEVAEIRSQLDAKVLEAAAATAKYDELVTMLEDAATADAEAAERAERLESRLAQIEEVANFPEDYIAAQSDRWAAMSDEAFEATLADYTAVAAGMPDFMKKKKKKEDETDLPDKSVLNSGAGREEASAKGSAINKGSLQALRNVDYSTL